MAFNLVATAIVSIIVESVLYGISVLLLAVTVWALLAQRSARTVNVTMSLATAALFILSTMHLIADSVRVYNGFVLADDSTSYLNDNTKLTFKNAVNEAETLVADAVLIYRCYVVWRDYRVILLPILGYLGVIATSTNVVYSISKPVTNATDIYEKQTAQWLLSFYSLAVATNLLATCLLSYKIWTVDRSSVLTRKATLKPVIIVTMECGALYSVTLIALIAVYVAKSNAAYLVTDIIGQVIPITFYIIIIRAALERLKRAAGGPGIFSTAAVTLTNLFPQNNNNMNTIAYGNEELRMKPFGVHVDEHTENDGR